MARQQGTRERRALAELEAMSPEAREELLNRCENTLREAVLAGQPWAVMFVLKTLGRDRGYEE
jgi:hypothetical protein